MKKLLLLLKKIKATESDGWKYAKSHTCCPGDDWADGYNQAVKDIASLIKKLLVNKEIW
jgi:hypothetical protein